tara:strand:+ start:1363 stop:1647 length:285 start_codon:yes stop_codon:yes gene_type:complete
MNEEWFQLCRRMRTTPSSQVSRDELAKVRDGLAALEAWADEVEESQLRSKLLSMDRWQFRKWIHGMGIPIHEGESQSDTVDRIMNIRRGIVVNL